MIDTQPDFQMLTTEYRPGFFIQLFLFWMLIKQVFKGLSTYCAVV